MQLSSHNVGRRNRSRRAVLQREAATERAKVMARIKRDQIAAAKNAARQNKPVFNKPVFNKPSVAPSQFLFNLARQNAARVAAEAARRKIAAATTAIVRAGAVNAAQRITDARTRQQVLDTMAAALRAQQNKPSAPIPPTIVRDAQWIMREKAKRAAGIQREAKLLAREMMLESQALTPVVPFPAAPVFVPPTGGGGGGYAPTPIEQASAQAPAPVAQKSVKDYIPLILAVGAAVFALKG